MSVTVGCDTVLTVDTKLPPSCNFLVSESFKIAVEVYNRWRDYSRFLLRRVEKLNLQGKIRLEMSRENSKDELSSSLLTILL
ncbi:hypothetical protein F2Q69_00013308 [Brassica cretica]|uniref:Uncharacterized protein n=1 Tax=Brassica cretica TaxID=69181 RepID=A0A8S9QVJ8_BRACR|nr:hypothetical protein F2Q69_00013308 [Brassica cretica]